MQPDMGLANQWNHQVKVTHHSNHQYVNVDLFNIGDTNSRCQIGCRSFTETGLEDLNGMMTFVMNM